MRIIHKPWGREEWIELNDKYCYKRIYINKGYKTSFQYHNFKHETNYIISGDAEIWLEDEITKLYSNLQIDFNKKDTIGSELDIFIPSLNIAFCC
jgi:mannose-6-phosphate isomerase-like protein (cupin superfamily)